MKVTLVTLPLEREWLALTYPSHPVVAKSMAEALSTRDFLGGSEVNNLPAMREMQETIPGLGRSSGEGHGNPLQYSCWENSMDRAAWRATVHGVTKSQTQLSK